MKKTFFAAITAVLLVFAITPACNNNTDEHAGHDMYNEDSARVAEEQAEARRDSAEVEDYRGRSIQTVEENDRRLVELKEDWKKQKKNIKTETQEQIDAWEVRSASLKDRLKNFKYESKENWQEFKTSVDAEMDSLEMKFKDIDFKKD